MNRRMDEKIEHFNLLINSFLEGHIQLIRSIDQHMNRMAEGEMTNGQMNRNSDGLTEEANGKMDR
jgi:hypothetical protein